MSKPQPANKSAAFVSGIAWVFLIVAVWACLRLSFMWMTSFGAATDTERQWIQLPVGLVNAWMIMHLALAAFTVYASYAMLKYRPWTRRYFAVALLLIGLEGAAAAAWMALGNAEAAATLPGMQGVKLAASVAMLLLGGSAILLAWKLWRDAGILAVFKSGSGE
jgi:hypothetical protein